MLLILAAILVALAVPAAAETIVGPACIHDGDTIRIGAHRRGDRCHGGIPVRIKGIAAPELPDHASSRDEASAGLAARRRMMDLAEGREVRCDLTDERTHDRRVGVCWAGSVDIGRALVQAGLALDCRRFSGGAYAGAERRELLAVYERPRYCGR